MMISLKAARVNAGLTQQQAASLIAVGKKTLWSWENGKTFPKVDQLKKLCEIYHVSMDSIFLPVKSTFSGFAKETE